MEPSGDSVIVPPGTVGEIAIHIGYLRRDIQSLSQKFDEVSKSYITHEELKPTLETVSSLKTFMDNSEGARDEAKKYARFSGSLAGAIVGGVVALIVSYLKTHL